MTDRLNEARAALTARDWTKARELLLSEIEENPSADAYYLFALVSDEDATKKEYLNYALTLDPNHEKAARELRRVEHLPEPEAPPTPVVVSESRPVDVRVGRPQTPKGNEPSLASRYNFEGQFGRDKFEPKYDLAGVGTRFVANILDNIIFLVLSNVAGFVLGLVIGTLDRRIIIDGRVSTLQAVAVMMSLGLYILYYLRPIVANGQTLGKQLCGIMIVKRDHSDLTWGDVILRNVIGYFLSAVILGIGYLIALGDENRQTLHDKLANTLVVKK